MACDRCNSIFHFWLSFALLPPPLLPAKKNQNSKKNKLKNPGDIITLHMYPKKYHQMYSS